MEFGELFKEITLTLNALHRKRVCLDGQTLSQCFLLSSILDDGIDMSSLAQKLGLDNSTMSRLVGTLFKKGFIEKRNDDYDRRVTKVYLTAEGEKEVIEIEEKLAQISRSAFDGVGEDKKGQLKESLETLHWILTKEQMRIN